MIVRRRDEAPPEAVGRRRRLPDGEINLDRKSAFWDAQRRGPDGSEATALVVGSQLQPFAARSKRDEIQFAPKAGARYDWTDDIGLFATWSRSFRGGGFNTTNAKEDPATRIFDPESATSWELGAKMRLLDGLTMLNVGLFPRS